MRTRLAAWAFPRLRCNRLRGGDATTSSSAYLSGSGEGTSAAPTSARTRHLSQEIAVLMPLSLPELLDLDLATAHSMSRQWSKGFIADGR